MCTTEIITEENSFYDVFDTDEEQLKRDKWMLGIEYDKTSEELLEQLQNEK